MISITGLLTTLFTDPLPFKIGEYIGQGNQGQVYHSLDKSDRVIKLSIIYDKFDGKTVEEVFQKTAATYKYIVDNPNPILSNIFEFGKLYKGIQEIFEWQQEYLIFYSIMEKLIPLNENEQKVFKTICSAYNKELKTYRPIEEIITELKEWIDFDKDKIIAFYNQLPSLDIKHKDFEPRNIMKDNLGNYKIIDFDLAVIKGENNENIEAKN